MKACRHFTKQLGKPVSKYIHSEKIKNRIFGCTRNIDLDKDTQCRQQVQRSVCLCIRFTKESFCTLLLEKDLDATIREFVESCTEKGW